MLQFFRSTHFDFLGKRRYAYFLSGLLMAASLGSLAVRGLNYGVDFRGGTEIRLKLRETLDPQLLRSRLEAAGLPDASLQRYGAPEANEVLVRVAGTEEEHVSGSVEDVSRRVLRALQGEGSGDPGDASKLDLNATSRAELGTWLAAQSELAAAGPEAAQRLADAIAGRRDEQGGLLSGYDALSAVPGLSPEVLQALRSRTRLGELALRSVDYVGPSVGKELRKKALLAVIGSLIGILLYLAFRFEYKYGVSAVVTVTHDALFTVGMFSLTGRPFDLTVVAAVLTIVGYSLNDTIVIFDRVRENLRLQRGSVPLEKVMNNSVNETLSRSILTSLTVMLVVASLYLFGGDRINDFAYAMLIGVVVGSYSTIYISCPFVLLWEAVRNRRRLRQAA